MARIDVEEAPVTALYRVMQMRHEIESKRPDSEWLDWLDEIEVALRSQREQIQKLTFRQGAWN